MNKKYLWLLLLILPAVPYFLWLLKSETPLSVAILDKTVPADDYREHSGLTWLLNHWKIVVPEDSSSYQLTDYAGWHPKNEKDDKIKKLDLSTAKPDVIYVADTYGVYPEQSGNSERGNDPIYGGLTQDEVYQIEKSLKEDASTLITEFNTLASPTDEKAKKAMYNLLGIQWSGWTGRYFNELDPNESSELPNWIIDSYQSQSSPWTFAGPGFVFSNEDGSLLVLEEEEHYIEKGLWIDYTEKGRNLFGIKESPAYGYWFDVIRNNSAEVLGNYKMDLTEKGKTALEEYGIPSSFPAVTLLEQGPSKRYYFAGDFVDTGSSPRMHKYIGLENIQKIFAFEKKDRPQTFYWKAYVPMMKAILNEVKNSGEEAAQQAADPKPMPALVKENQYQVLKDGKWEQLTIKGVNMGIAKPGYFPGETAITRDEYYRWFEMIHEMNANAIRVYTLHPPGFYQALKQFNDEHKEDPLYVFHGIWIDEGPLEETLDAFSPGSSEPFIEEMKRIVDVVHGNANISDKPGHASGIYTADISDYVIGWILGIEWYPYMVENTNKVHASKGEYDGSFTYTKGAAPFENWLAGMMDTILVYDDENYGTTRPVSFTNWVTTDLLDHPSEPLEQEDLVSVDPNVIYLKDEKSAGQFASYHVYPYYPDFLNLEEKYLNYIDHRGNKNSYAGYLNDLQQAHRLPVLIAEFGVPGSRGMTHENPYGWNQGFHNEEDQGTIDASLFEDIINEGFLGGLVFTWQDEWFKRTWNTLELDNSDRRPFWSNAQTNEQQFGLLSFDRHKVKLDGDTSDWKDVQALYDHTEEKQSELQSLKIDHDEKYLYLNLKLSDSAIQDWDERDILFLLDNGKEGGNMVSTSDSEFEGIDFVLHLNGKENSRILTDSSYDPFYYQYSEQLSFLSRQPYHGTQGSGVFHPIKLALNKPLFIPSTGETFPFKAYETGRLRFGIGSPEDAEYDSLSDFYVNEEDGIIEVRIPWLMLNFRDPSQKEIIGDLWSGGMDASAGTDGIKASVLFGSGLETNTENLMVKNFKASGMFPEDGSSVKKYTWEKWDLPLYEERLKKSYFILQELYGKYE
ncbi:hypothetical protein [Rossellomorea aquimaris]|uniref:Uncharacterized protein n=1 Tax=Rossellomorea aquimaris TaxID=189382 RepID=A0A5D4U134_9BACI|nr:hypothetical protein [Rossellomorea aquimaris]TYS81014.1 hypothetical protein FZC80_07895 [Rossellomorea aquimaris]